MTVHTLHTPTCHYIHVHQHYIHYAHYTDYIHWQPLLVHHPHCVRDIHYETWGTLDMDIGTIHYIQYIQCMEFDTDCGSDIGIRGTGHVEWHYIALHVVACVCMHYLHCIPGLALTWDYIHLIQWSCLSDRIAETITYIAYITYRVFLQMSTTSQTLT